MRIIKEQITHSFPYNEREIWTYVIGIKRHCDYMSLMKERQGHSSKVLFLNSTEGDPYMFAIIRDKNFQMVSELFLKHGGIIEREWVRKQRETIFSTVK